MPVRGYDKLYKEVDQMLQTDRVMIPAMNGVLASQKKRIFQLGKATDESKIGTYSEKPISISKKNQSRNTGKTYFPKGYRQYKSLTGKGSSFVNLRNTDQMMFDLGTHKLSENEYSIGFTNDFNADKAKWMEDKYDKEIFNTSASEDNLAMKIIQIELNKID